MLEYEEVYPGIFYGTLRSDVASSTVESPVLLDVDVRGAMSVKAAFGASALAIFIAPPSLDELARRLQTRGTEDAQNLKTRLERARTELSYADRFDARVINDDLVRATEETVRLVRSFLDT
jgi:guanylate kinase